MSTLSFVALSMQTTHLDPATVSKASYIKLVDGNITRVDAIPIIPPAPTSENGSHSPDEAVSWPDALGQLSMVFGKLPIVSYYRDADKEIFQAASRRSDITPPTFHWLDCRALARKVLPELSDHQPSTVLKALDLYDEYADSDTVEQTARIVLKLAQRQEAATVRELWDDLYHQPDDLLDLETTLQDLSPSEAAENNQPEVSADGESEATPGNQTLNAAGAAAAVTTSVGPSPNQTSDATPETETLETLSDDSPTHVHVESMETELAHSETVAHSETATATVAPSGQELAPEITNDDAATTETDESDTEPSEVPDSTAQSIIDHEHLEEPEFLKIRDDDELEFETPPVGATPESNTDPVETSTEPYDQGSVSADAHDPEGVDGTEPETPDRPGASRADLLPPEEPNHDVDETTPGVPHNLDEQDAEVPTATTEQANIPAEQTAVSPTEPTPVVNAAEQPAPIARPSEGSTAASVKTEPIASPNRLDERHHPEPAEPDHKPVTRASRIWGVVGMILFGLMTVLGLGLTIMAITLFFTTNDLLLETKIAGVILTGAITLLSLLMTVLSYRTYRKNP